MCLDVLIWAGLRCAEMCWDAMRKFGRHARQTFFHLKIGLLSRSLPQGRKAYACRHIPAQVYMWDNLDLQKTLKLYDFLLRILLFVISDLHWKNWDRLGTQAQAHTHQNQSDNPIPAEKRGCKEKFIISLSSHQVLHSLSSHRNDYLWCKAASFSPSESSGALLDESEAVSRFNSQSEHQKSDTDHVE